MPVIAHPGLMPMKSEYKYLLFGVSIGLAIAAGLAIVGHGSGSLAPADTHNGTILLTGDTREDQFIPLSDIFSLPQADVPSLANRSGNVATRGVPVPEFLAAYGVDDYDRLVFYADDYTLAINRSDVTGEMILVPDSVSLRVLAGNLPVNSWIKNVRYVVVVGGDNESSVSLNGEEISYGSMLEDGIDLLPYYRGTTGYRQDDREFVVETAGVAEGIPLSDFLIREGCTDFSKVTVSGGGSTESFDRSEVLAGGLFLTRFQGAIKLARNDSLQARWKNIDSIVVE